MTREEATDPNHFLDVRKMVPAKKMTREEATEAINTCHLCWGKPFIRYEPGCSYTTCLMRKPDCPSIASAPDDELALLVDRVNADEEDEEEDERSR